MRLFKNKFWRRTLAIFFLLVFVNNILFPTVSYALTNGPHQVEFTSFEDASSADMVNLLTGDFSYNMPLINVPVGEDGEYSIPLSYHAGIGTDQEASWVGLGWNINTGSLTRNINGFPDDASGEVQSINVQDLNALRGWSASFLGTNIGWDSQNGHYGTISLVGGMKLGYDDSGLSSVGIVGLTVSKSGDVDFSVEQFSMALVQAAMAVATAGSGNLALNVALEVGSSVAMDMILPEVTPTAPTSGNWKYSKRTNRRLFHTDYWIYLNQTRKEEMYGILNLHSAPKIAYTRTLLHKLTLKEKINTVVTTPYRFHKSSDLEGDVFAGAASDINIDLSASTDYWNLTNPAMLAYDNYNVNAPSISGSIKPYRLEVGSVAVARDMSDSHTRLNLVPYIDYGTNKVPFMYEGTIGNKYFHHVGASTSVTSPTFYYGINTSHEAGTASTSVNNDAITYDLNDIILSNQRVRSDIDARKKIPQGNFVAWHTNAEIKNQRGGFSSGFIDYFPSNDTNLDMGSRYVFREIHPANGNKTYYSPQINAGVIILNQADAMEFELGEKVDIKLTMTTGSPIYHYGLQVISKAINSITVNNTSISGVGASFMEVISKHSLKKDGVIGGYVITSQDGMNYHFSLPVYDYNFYMHSRNAGDYGKNSTISRTGHFANTWLLTAITGPDFVDRGNSDGSANGVIDNNDWGYWIKFNYGRHVTDYKWRLPHEGYKKDSDNSYESYVEGNKEKYYLNTVETKSHVAMFIKGIRSDAKDADPSPVKKTSLKLSEIVLMTKESYQHLTTPANGYGLADCNGKIDVVYQTGACQAGSCIGSSVLNYLQTNAIKRVIFNTDYALCVGAKNSDSGLGKLTLKSVSVRGKNNVKIFPDYKFEYSNNPNYSINQWDGWGMYASSGTSVGTTHKATQNNADGAAWSLTRVVTPLGSKIDVEYERDDYSTISGVVSIPQITLPASDHNLSDGITAPASGYFQTGERVMVGKDETWYCSGGGDPESQAIAQTELGGEEGLISHTVMGTYNGTNVILDSPLDPQPTSRPCASGGTVTSSISGAYITKLGNNRKGGNLRVKSIGLSDEFNSISNKSRYIYTNDGGLWSTSSGVVSMEPDYIKTVDYDFYKWTGYQASPVMYGKVTVLVGRLTDENDYYSKQVYEFETPNANQYSLSTVNVKDKVLMDTYAHISGGIVKYHSEYSTLKDHRISRRFSKVGKLKSVKTFSKNDNLNPYSSVSYIYTDTPTNEGVNNYQGVFTEGTLLFEIIDRDILTRYNKGQRTTLIDYPYTLQKIVNVNDGIQSETENKNWDLFTGAILETRTKSGLGLTFKSIVEPAYKSAYPEMGSKAVNPAYKNMLSQTAATYSYRLDHQGNEIGLVSATANVWKKDWVYRKLNGTNEYINDPLIDIWRKSAMYVYKGDYASLKEDGTQRFVASNKFNFSNLSANTKWQLVGSTEKYAHGSSAMETKDFNGIYSTKKVGYNELYTIASASNARFDEIAFSSAEDKLSSPYFGGEVGLGTGASIVTSPVHSGKQALLIPINATGFVFKSKGISANKTYRASVWCNSSVGRIYYKINGAESTPTPKSSQGVLKNGTTWYRLDIDIPIGGTAPTDFEVGVKTSNGATLFFDDFRFQPIQSTLTGYVYYPDTKQLMETLDNDNLSTRYEYNTRGLLAKTYRESLSYGEKLVSESADNYRRFTVDQ